jgi:site-specific recombinase XerD
VSPPRIDGKDGVAGSIPAGGSTHRVTSANAGQLRSFERHLRAENRSDNTIESYLESIRQAEAFLAARGRNLLDARRAELVGLRLADLDLDVAIVLGKGRRERALPFGRKTAAARRT